MPKKVICFGRHILIFMLILISGCTAGSSEDNDRREPQLEIEPVESTSIPETLPQSLLSTTQVVSTIQPASSQPSFIQSSVEDFSINSYRKMSVIDEIYPSPGVLVDVVEREAWIWQAPGKPVLAPVLLYHHIGYANTINPYFLTPELFEDQLDWIVTQGYTAISPTLLAEALRSGAFMPSKPILITFDDGSDDLFSNAFPAVQIRNMAGTAYLVGDCINQHGCIRVEEIREMYAAGWEFGNHSMTHADLTGTADIETEMLNSGKYLHLILNIPIDTFAYPYGAGDPGLFQRCREYGYSACMGIGDNAIHNDWSLYYLSRLVVSNGMTADDLAQMIAKAETRPGID